MKRIVLAVTVLFALLALAPACHAAEDSSATAAVAPTVLPFQAVHCAVASSPAQPDLQRQLDGIFSPAAPQDTPCFKCFNLGLDCCPTPTGGTKCC